MLSTAALPNIPSSQKASSEQLISLKAQVMQVSYINVFHTQFQGKVRKHKVMVRDTTSFMKIILWEDNVDTTQKQNTAAKKPSPQSKTERFLNTAKLEKFTLFFSIVLWL